MLLLALPAGAEQVYRAQREGDLVESMNELQSIIHAKGYQVMRVLPVDMGLENVGYEHEPYRIVFYGKAGLPDVMRRYPELVAYLPLSITMHERQGVTGFVAISPLALVTEAAPPELMALLQAWDADMRAIFSGIKQAP